MNPYAVDIADLGADRLNVSGVFPPGALDVGGEIGQVGDVEWSGYLERKGSRIRFAGSLTATLEPPCVRCLEPSREVLRRDFDLFFEERDSFIFEEDAEIELEEADTHTAFITGTMLNLADVIAEQLVLALPMKPLCASDCKGLCPVCGRNLNTDPCECTVPDVHPAFEGLLALKERMEGGSR